MIVEKGNLIKWLFSFFAIILGCTVISITSNIIIHLAIIVAFVVLCVYYSKLNFAHPLFWFSIFFFLYSCAYMMIITMYPDDILAKGYDKESAILILIALGVTVLCVGFTERIYDYSALNNPEQYRFDIRVLNVLFHLFCLILLACVIVLRLKGVTSKQAQWEQHNLFWVFAAYSTRFLVFILSALFFMGVDNATLKRKTILAIILVALYSMSTGERDGLLRLIIVLLFVLALLNLIKKRSIIIIGAIGSALMILTGYLKYFFTTGLLNSDFISRGNIFYAFLYSDFADCGSNLQMLLNHPELKGVKGFSVLISDFLSAFLPSRVMNMFSGNDASWNVSQWYNDYFYRGSSWNRAFTIIGEGYVISGVIGVIVIFIILGLMIKWMYKRSGESPYYAALYVYGAATIISCFRGDLASVFQGLIRIPLTIIIIMWIARKIVVPDRYYKKI